MRHYFTVDVEEYFQVHALQGRVSRADWPRFASRVGASLTWLLTALARHETRATFFVLGWLAERQPWLVREIARARHEIASHGWDHARVPTQAPRSFRASVRRTKRLLEDLTGQPVLGFRAPGFSIVPGYEWALDVLLEEGHRYDSSLFPIQRRGSGYPGGRRDPHWLRRPAGRLLEFPPATLRWLGVNLPAGGGAYFRLLPYALVRAALGQAERRGAAATFYIHPWELDPGQPRLAVPWLTALRHYGGLAGTRARLERLLSEFRFTAVADAVPRAAHSEATPA